VREDRRDGDFNVVGRNEVRVIQRRGGAARFEQRPRRARTGDDRTASVLPRFDTSY